MELMEIPIILTTFGTNWRNRNRFEGNWVKMQLEVERETLSRVLIS